MKAIYTKDTTPGIADASNALLEKLRAGKKVLWLVCGGSSIPAISAIMQTIPAELTTSLSIMLTDERYGELDHPDSNWRQLHEAGFDFKHARQLPTLQANLSLEETIDYYSQLAETALAEADVVIAQFGIGADGHIAGILPHSAAITEQTRLAAGYQTDPFIRLTLTFPALRQIDAAYVFVFGDSKLTALTQLTSQTLSLQDQPAQILKQLPQAFLYNDQLETPPEGQL